MGKARKVWGRIAIGALAVAMLVIAGGMGALLGISLHTSVNTTFHTVRFSFDNNIVSTQAVADGKTAVAPFLPSLVTDHNGYEYDFVGWTQDGETIVDPNTIAVTENANYAAMFKFTGYVSVSTVPTEYVGTYDVPEDQQVYAGDIWQLGNNVYYSNDDEQYKLAADGETWEPQIWYNLAGLDAQYIWVHDNVAYYSDGKTQYKLANGRNNWEPQNWAGDFTPSSGEYVWQCGDDVYYSYYSDQYKLNTATNEWVQQNWKGDFKSFDGKYIWQYNGNAYYSKGSTTNGRSPDQYKLNTDTNEWERQTWDEINNIFGEQVWQFDGNVYCSRGSYQYKLTDNGVTWQEYEWVGLGYLDASSIWQHAGNVYYLDGDERYKLMADGKTWQRIVYLTATGEFDRIDPDNIWYANGNTYYGKNYQLKDSKWVLLENYWQYDSNSISSDIGSDNIWSYVDTAGQEHTYCFYYDSKVGDLVAELVDGYSWQTINLTRDFYDTLYASYIWEYDRHVYYTYEGETYEITITTDGLNFTKVENLSFNNDRVDGSSIWQHDGHLYSSYKNQWQSYYNYSFEYVDGQWVNKTWNMVIDGSSVFHLNGEVCIISGSTLYHLVDDKWEIATMRQDGLNTAITINGEKFYYKTNYYTNELYKNATLYKYESLYYCPEAKVDNNYINDHKLDFSNDFGSSGGVAADQ